MQLDPFRKKYRVKTTKREERRKAKVAQKSPERDLAL